jgi:hypothetical protein
MNQQDHDHAPGCGAVSRTLRRTPTVLCACLPTILWAVGCASTKTTESEVFVSEQLPWPSHIWVYDFAATAAAVPPNSTLARKFTVEATPQTARQIALGRQLGAHLATDLVRQIQEMGLPAERAVGGEAIAVNDLVIRGYLVSIKKGNPAERIIIGFGIGRSELRTIVEGFQMTRRGLRELNFGAVQAGGSKSPGASVSVVGLLATGYPFGLIISSGMGVYGEASGRSTLEGRVQATAKEIAAELKKLFQAQGWIGGQARSAHPIGEILSGPTSSPPGPDVTSRSACVRWDTTTRQPGGLVGAAGAGST